MVSAATGEWPATPPRWPPEHQGHHRVEQGGGGGDGTNDQNSPPAQMPPDRLRCRHHPTPSSSMPTKSSLLPPPTRFGGAAAPNIGSYHPMASLATATLPGGPTPHPTPALITTTKGSHHHRHPWRAGANGREPRRCPPRQPHGLCHRLPLTAVSRGAREVDAAARVMVATHVA
jgi:hypothetical protein